MTATSPLEAGGPENPHAFAAYAENCGQVGMTLRDYFAAHADQPGVSEIATAAGKMTDGFYVWEPLTEDIERDRERFTDWWNGGLTLETRCALSAKVRFAMADAMLRARSEHTQ